MHLTKIITQSLLTLLLNSTIFIYPMKRTLDSMNHTVVASNSDENLSQTLKEAALNGKLSLIQSLENTYRITNEQFTECFFSAAESGHIDILDYIAQKVGIACLKSDSAPYVALQSAAKEGRIEVIKCILTLGIRYVNDPLITAIDHSHVEIVQELVNHGAKVNGSSYHIKPSSILGYAIQKKNYHIIEILLTHGAQIDKNEWQNILANHSVSHKIQRNISQYFPYINEPFTHINITYYAILGVPNDASTSAIKKAYYALAKIHHPDRADTIPINTEIFKVINNAYECLSNPSKKRLYDLSHNYGYSLSEEPISLPACQICRKHCFTVQLKIYSHSCCTNNTVLCEPCEKQHAQISKNYLPCCEK